MSTSLMEWMMILVRNSSGSSSIKHTAAAIKENGGNSTATGLEIEWRRGMKWARRIEVEDG
jgi:hypothetical protein